MNILRALCVAWGLAAASAWAALPDPVTLGVAVETGDIERARGWLDEGLDPDMAADRVGSGLMIAAWEGNIPMMELFLSRGADVHRTNRLGEQALQLAAWRGHLEAVRWLMDHGAEVNRQGKAWGALHYAVFAGQREIVKLLMARGADVNARAPNDASVLMMAAREGHEELARQLLDAGADPRLASDRGETALTWAMRQGNFRIAKMVSSAEAFAQAVKAPPETFRPARKSAPAPSEITELLRKMREAEARGESADKLRQALMAAIERFKADSTEVSLKGKRKAARPARNPALVITASRRGRGERAEVVETRPGSPASAAATPAQQAWSYDEDRLHDFTRLLEELDAAEKRGLPTADLRRAVREAYGRMKGGR